MPKGKELDNGRWEVIRIMEVMDWLALLGLAIKILDSLIDLSNKIKGLIRKSRTKRL
jgi:hypothetical protein